MAQGSRYKGAILTSNGVLVWIDEEDFDRLSETSWYVEKNGYVRNSRHQLLHRVVLRLGHSRSGIGGVDHINGNKLDNTKANLRLATATQNQWNRKKVGYAEFDSRYRLPWVGRIRMGKGMPRTKARFSTKLEAEASAVSLAVFLGRVF